MEIIALRITAYTKEEYYKPKKINMDKLPVCEIVVEDNDDTGVSLITLEFEIVNKGANGGFSVHNYRIHEGKIL